MSLGGSGVTIARIGRENSTGAKGPGLSGYFLHFPVVVTGQPELNHLSRLRFGQYDRGAYSTLSARLGARVQICDVHPPLR